jgi:hypothetical protein
VTEPPAHGQPTPSVVLEAAKASDYFIQAGVGPGPHSRDFYVLLFDHGVSAGFLAMSEDELLGDIGRYPFEVWGEIHNRLKWHICDNQIETRDIDFRLTDDRGSDLRWTVRFPLDIGAWIGPEPLSAGSWNGSRPRVMHRAGFLAFLLTMGDLQYTASGTLYVDSTNYLGRTTEPLKLTFDHGRCTAIEGSDLAEQIWDMAIRHNRNGDRVRELAIAIHPKSNGVMPAYDPDLPVPVAPVPHFAHGDFTVALGGDTGVGGVDPGSEDAVALFAQAKNTTITADGKTILEAGRLLILEDPELREFAAQFGDPDELLSPAGTEED